MSKITDKNVFESNGYKDYLRRRMGSPGAKTGSKSALSKAMDCQATYLSQVLNGHAHLSLEQAERANHHFEHTKDESLYFLLLVQRDRAGTQALRRFFQEQLEEILKRRLVLTHRLGKKQALSQEDQSIYYSSWVYSAVHIALTIPELQFREALADYLNLPMKRLSEILDFLSGIGLVVHEGGRYRTIESHVRLGNDSHNILKHHANWRSQALESLDREQITDLHYSGVISLARADVPRVKEVILEAIRKIQEMIRDSKEEELYGLAFDSFWLKK